MSSSAAATDIVVLLLPDLATATLAAEQIRTAVYGGRFDAVDWAIAENVDGKVRLHHSNEPAVAVGFGEGALIGGIVGIFAGAVLAPALFVGAVGAAVSSLHRGGIPKAAMDEIGRAIAEGHTAVFVLTDANSARILASEIFANSTVRTFTIASDDADAVTEVAEEITASLELVAEPLPAPGTTA